STNPIPGNAARERLMACIVNPQRLRRQWLPALPSPRPCTWAHTTSSSRTSSARTRSSRQNSSSEFHHRPRCSQSRVSLVADQLLKDMLGSSVEIDLLSFVLVHP